MQAGELDFNVFERRTFGGRIQNRLLVSVGRHGADVLVSADDLEAASRYLAREANKLRAAAPEEANDGRVAS